MDWMGLVSIAVSVITITAFVIARKDAAIREGKHLAEVVQLRKDVDRAMAQIEVLREGHNDVNIGLEVLKNDMGYIKDKLNSILSIIDRRATN